MEWERKKEYRKIFLKQTLDGYRDNVFSTGRLSVRATVLPVLYKL